MSGERRFALHVVGFDRASQEVSMVSAVVTGSGLETVQELAGQVLSDAIPEEPGKLALAMGVDQTLKLFHAAGKIPGTDPRYPVVHEIWESLAPLVYGLIEVDA